METKNLADNRKEMLLLAEITGELANARRKFPGDNVTMLALMEEVGELAKATFEEPRDNVRKEAVQVAVMAIRVVLDGDATLDDWREAKGLDPLVEPSE
jgi:NTP pyrophosphatase (non-canonical NTP hydrolase)